MKRRKPPSQRQKPLDAPGSIRMVTKMMVAFGRQLGGTAMDACDSDEKIRADIKAAFTEAIEGDQEFRMPVQFKDGHVESCVTYAGTFRMVFEHHNLDRKDPWSQEKWWSIVEETMNWALAQNDGDFRRRSA